MRAEGAGRLEVPGWVNLRTVLGAALFLIALASGSRVLAAAEGGTSVWVLTRDVAVGARLAEGDVRRAEVNLAPEQLSTYVSAEAQVEGALVVRGVRRGELLAAAAVAPSGTPSDQRSITVPVTSVHAVGGRVATGDLVDILATVDARGPAARTTLLVGSAVVQDVVLDPTFGAGEAALVGITVAVDPDQALRIALATRSADIDVVRVDGPAGDAVGEAASLSLEDL